MMESLKVWNVAVKYNMSPNQLYFLDCCRYKIKPSKLINEEAEKMICIQKGFIDLDCHLSITATQMLAEYDTFLDKTKKKVAKEVLGENFMEKVNTYRQLFPKIRFPSGSLARQSTNELKDKFIWFFKTFPEYDWELVFDATDYYLYLKKQVDYQYAVTSSYFIKKTETLTKETKSILADYCQQLLDDPNLLSS
jgi:hypothetical protein